MAKEPAKSENKQTTAPAERGGGYVHPLARFRDEMDNLFDDFWGRPFGRDVWGGVPAGGPFQEMMGGGRAFAPIDVKESDNAYTVEAELPGLTEKDVTLELRNGVLSLRGEKKSERDEKKDDYHVTERSFGSFQRSVRVPDGIDEDKISAAFKNGVLTVTLPKSKEAQKKMKKIPIKG